MNEWNKWKRNPNANQPPPRQPPPCRPPPVRPTPPVAHPAATVFAQPLRLVRHWRCRAASKQQAERSQARPSRAGRVQPTGQCRFSAGWLLLLPANRKPAIMKRDGGSRQRRATMQTSNTPVTMALRSASAPGWPASVCSRGNQTRCLERPPRNQRKWTTMSANARMEQRNGKQRRRSERRRQRQPAPDTTNATDPAPERTVAAQRIRRETS